ncbi:MAG: magnesium chelatase, partial [Chloroflexota bacterium]
PDLAERLQVGLFNLMEERDIQIRGYPIRLPVNLLVVASANPEDYTNRGRIITPLKDRFGAQIRTHYPTTIEDEIAIVEAERRQFRDDKVETYVPSYMKEIIAEVTHLARKSPELNQSSGVSVRVSIANYETMLSNAIRRAVNLSERLAVPRISDLPFIHASTGGKIELESFEDTKEGRVIDELIKKAVLNVFNRFYQPEKLVAIVAQFNEGFSLEASDMMSSRIYMHNIKEIIGFEAVIRRLDIKESPESVASAMEFILEGLHLNRKLNKTESRGKAIYRR